MLVIGCDWARSKHDFVLMNSRGDILSRHTVDHDAQALNDLARRIAKIESDPAQVLIGLELHDGALLAWLLQQRYSVYGINPKSAERARAIYRPAGAKDDAGDAWVHAELVRTGRQHLKALHPDSPRTQQLRTWTRLRQKLVQQKTAACQQLRGLLAEWHPPLSRLCSDLNTRWQRNLLAECPDHQALRQMHGNRLNAFCRRHRLAEQTRQRIAEARAARPMPVPPARREALNFEIGALVETIERLTDRIKEVDRRLKPLLDDHPDAAVFQSLPVRGQTTVCTLLAAFGDDRQRTPSWRVLAARWGVAPITKQSGRSKTVRRRAACDHGINQALLFFAFNTAFTDGCWAADYYQKKRRCGVDHYTTLRCLAGKWVKILHRLWLDRTPYNEHLHQKNRQQRNAA